MNRAHGASFFDELSIKIQYSIPPLTEKGIHTTTRLLWMWTALRFIAWNISHFSCHVHYICLFPVNPV